MGSIRPWPLGFSYVVRVSSGTGRTDGNNNANNGDAARDAKEVIFHSFILSYDCKIAPKFCQEKFQKICNHSVKGGRPFLLALAGDRAGSQKSGKIHSPSPDQMRSHGRFAGKNPSADAPAVILRSHQILLHLPAYPMEEPPPIFGERIPPRRDQGHGCTRRLGRTLLPPALAPPVRACEKIGGNGKWWGSPGSADAQGPEKFGPPK
jgi:hypothetical protein